MSTNRGNDDMMLSAYRKRRATSADERNMVPMFPQARRFPRHAIGTSAPWRQTHLSVPDITPTTLSEFRSLAICQNGIDVPFGAALGAAGSWYGRGLCDEPGPVRRCALDERKQG